MLMGAPNWMFETDLQDGVVNQSAKFDDASSDYMLLNKSANGNRRTFTLSWWMKMGNIFTGTIYTSGYSGSGGTATSGHIRSSSQKLAIENQVNNSNTWSITSSRLFRDPTNWYHCVVAIDTTQSTASDRVKLYINGTQETVTGTYPNEDDDVLLNNQYEKIGTWDDGGSAYFDYDGYLADFILVDGTALAPTSFGREVDGVWIPKDTSGLTFGTKGWRLEFKNTGTGTASSSTVGADTSGNNFHFTSYGHPLGNMSDCPDNNFATMNPLIKSANTFSEGNLKVTTTTSTPAKFVSTMGVTSGKWFMEFRHSGDANYPFGIASDTQERDYLGLSDGSTSVAIWGGSSNSNAFVNGSQVSWNGSGTTWSAGDIIGLALNADDSILEVYKNGVSVGSYDYSALNWSDHFFAAGNYVAATFSANFGQDDTFAGAVSSNGNTGGGGKFRHAPPAGYKALCSKNLEEPIFSANPTRPENANDHFNTKIYTGNGYPASGTQSITGVGFQSDFTWIKNRDRSSYNHYVFDSIRGATKALRPNLTNAENTESTSLTSFDSDGFSLGANNEVNYEDDSIVSWNWKAGGDIADVSGNFIKDGVAFTPTQGTIDATAISANTTSGLSIVKFTSDLSSSVSSEADTPPTIAHGLGAIPRFVIIKDIDGGSYPHWNIWHQGYQPDQTYLNYHFIGLQTDAAANNAGWYRGDTGFTTDFFCPPVYQYNETGKTYICYVFAEVEGYSKFGSYVGNNNVDGPYVHLGFKPAMIILKRGNDSGGWQILDNKRNTFNPVDNYLLPNLANSEYDGSTLSPAINLDFVSNGVKVRTTESVYNSSGGTFIYMAFAEQPFKYSNAA